MDKVTQLGNDDPDLLSLFHIFINILKCGPKNVPVHSTLPWQIHAINKAKRSSRNCETKQIYLSSPVNLIKYTIVIRKSL